ncbi:MAG: hypothetical protein ACO23R_02655 [bacterium]
MSKMSIFSAISNRVLAEIKQSRIVTAISQSRILISQSELGRFFNVIIKNIADSIGFTEFVAKVFGKGLIDSSAVSEATQIETNKNLADTVFFIDDNQIINFSKVLSNPASASDSVSLAAEYNRAFNDSGVSSDSVSLISSFSRGFNNAVSIADQITIEIVMPISFSDSAFASDQLQSVVVYSRDFQDTIEGLDASIFGFDTGQIDAGFVGDQAELTVNFSRTFESTVIATDDIGGEATIDDDQTIQFFKQITNLAQASENAIKFAGKTISDIIVAADSGTLLNQDYVDNPFYFAEDYVGIKRTF